MSAGFDAYAHDPLAEETLEAEDYYWLGQSFRKLGVPYLAFWREVTAMICRN